MFHEEYIRKTSEQLQLPVEEVRTALPGGKKLVDKIDGNPGIEFAFSDEELRLLNIALTYYLFDPSRFNREMEQFKDLES